MQQSSIHTKCDCSCQSCLCDLTATTRKHNKLHSYMSHNVESSWLWRLLMLKPTLSIHIKLDNKLTILISPSFFLNGDKDDTLKKNDPLYFFYYWFIFVVLHMFKNYSETEYELCNSQTGWLFFSKLDRLNNSHNSCSLYWWENTTFCRSRDILQFSRSTTYFAHCIFWLWCCLNRKKDKCQSQSLGYGVSMALVS